MKLEKLIKSLTDLYESGVYADGTHDDHNILIRDNGKIIGEVWDVCKDGIVDKDGIENTEIILIMKDITKCPKTDTVPPAKVLYVEKESV